METGQALLQSILDNPKEDTPRLVYADWLDENAGEKQCRGIRHIWPFSSGTWQDDEDCKTCSGTGRVSNGYGERAEFIRVQVELARVGCQHMMGNRMSCRSCQLRRRERELFQGGVGAVILREGPFGGVHYQDVEPIPESVSGFVSRGFVSSLTCTWDAWRTHAPAILAAQPIERVRLTTEPGVVWSNFMGAMSDGRECWLQDENGRAWGKSVYVLYLINPEAAVHRIRMEVLKGNWPNQEFELPEESSRIHESDPRSYTQPWRSPPVPGDTGASQYRR